MSYFTEQQLFDSKKYFFDERLTCWMACLMSWTNWTPFDNNVEKLEDFQQLMKDRKWRSDDNRDECQRCQSVFGLWNRKHHCRLCGDIFCGACSEVREIKCCYRENLYIRACHHCYQMFKERWKLFHDLQKRWMASEGKVSDCCLPKHPKLPRPPHLDIQSLTETVSSGETSHSVPQSKPRNDNTESGRFVSSNDSSPDGLILRRKLIENDNLNARESDSDHKSICTSPKRMDESNMSITSPQIAVRHTFDNDVVPCGDTIQPITICNRKERETVAKFNSLVRDADPRNKISLGDGMSDKTRMFLFALGFQVSLLGFYYWFDGSFFELGQNSTF